MNKYSSLKIKENELAISSQFNNWLERDRGRQVRGIGRFLKMRSNLTDSILTSVWKIEGLADEPDLGLFSVGGYGRGELHPFSDIDLLVLSKTNLNKEKQKLIEKFISHLWDLGFDLGHSVRSILDSRKQAAADIRTMTNMLETRFIAGDKAMKIELYNIREHKSLWPGASFFHAKENEQIERHLKFNNTEYNLEPDVKSSPGGLRDVQTLEWLILKYSRKFKNSGVDLSKIITPTEENDLKKAKYWLWTIRYLLHTEANREEDRLLFEYQISVAMKLFPSVQNPNAAAEKLMHRYYRSALTVSEINSTVIQALKENLIPNKFSRKKKIDINFYQKNSLIGLTNLDGFKKNPSLLLVLFLKLSENPNLIGIESQTLRSLKEDRDLINSDFRKKKNNINLFLNLLRSKRLMVTQLEHMKELGILGRYLPEFGRITGQMQYDLFHIYTVDAHTLQVLRNMRRMLSGTSKKIYPLASEVIKALPKMEVLYIAGLYHDIGKGRGKDHSALGTAIVRRFCKNHEFEDIDRKLIEWLVVNHLTMSKKSQKEDLSDEDVIRQFSELVKNQTRLDYLYCLTVADVSATNPNLWNSWNSSLLGELYAKTSNYLKGNRLAVEPSDIKFLKGRIIRDSEINEEDLDKIWNEFYPNYFNNFNEAELALHAKMLVTNNRSTLVNLHKDESGITNLLIYTRDRPNVFAATIGVLDSENINFLDANLFGMKNGFCFDCLKISDQEGNPLVDSAKTNKTLSKLKTTLDKKIITPKIVQKRIPRHLKHFNLKTSIKVEHDMVNRWTQIDIKTTDRPGLLASVSKVFVAHNAVIKKARIATYGERAEDRFCISSTDDTPFLKKKELETLITDLQNSLKLI
jgi:[protein-PII] uridylyltransferase